MNESGTAVDTVSIPDRKQAKARAKIVLSSGNNRLTLAVSLIIFITAAVTCQYIGYMLINTFGVSGVSYNSLRYWLLNIGYVLWTALTALFGNIPILYGIYAVTNRMCIGETAVVADVFEVFSDGDLYLKTLKLSCRTVIKYIVPFAAAVFFPEIWVRLLAMLYTLFCVFFIESDFGFAASVYSNKPRKNYRRINYGVIGNGKRIVAFKFSFLPWILLSVATVGVLFVIHTVPYMMISNSIYYNGLEEAVDN